MRSRTKLADVVRCVRERKWRWASRIASLESSRLARAVLEWHPRGPVRGRGRPAVRWRDDLVKACGTGFLAKAADRKEWKRLMEQALG